MGGFGYTMVAIVRSVVEACRVRCSLHRNLLTNTREMSLVSKTTFNASG